MNRYKILSLLIISVCLQTSFAQQIVDGIAAIVGQEIILKSEVEQYVNNYVIQNRINITSDPAKYRQLQNEVLERLVEQKILLTKADEDTITVSDREVDRYLEEQIRTLISRVGSEAELEAAFESPIKQIRRDLRKETENRLKIETLRRTKFQGISVSRREVEEFYNSFRDSLPKLKETVDISHILKQIRPGEGSQQAALERIKAIKEKIDAGENFSDLAKEYSEDPGTAARGGDLGFIKRGDFVTEFEEAAFMLEANQVSDIVRTQFGFHLIKMKEKRGEKIHTAHILIQLRPTADDEKRVVEELRAIRQKIIDGAGFEEIAMAESEDENVANDKGHLGVWEVEKLAIPQFKKVVTNLETGEISQPFKTDYGYHIVLLHSHQKPRPYSIKEDWEQIKNMALNYKIEKEYKEWIEKLKQDIPIEYKTNFN